MRAGSTLVACLRSEETWKFGGLMGGKDPLLQKEKGKTAATLLSWSSFWVPGNQTQPTSKMPAFILQDSSSKWLQTQHSTSNLFDRPAAKTGEDPRSPSPPCRHLTSMTPAALLAAPGCAGAQTAQAWGQLTSCKFHHNSHCLRHRAQRQACKSTALRQHFK